ncbi:MAG: tetratricopeptide repeat protein [Xenococcaceae cyanobacterium]
MQRGNYVALAGMGGVGKTELATQYARRYEDDYGGIVWFNARETNLAKEVLKFFSLQLGLEIPQKDWQERLLTLKEQVAWCWSNYPNSELPIFIVFDDVTALANLREAFPTDNRFRVLVTTRLRNLDPAFIQEIPIDVLSPAKEPGKALELLKWLLGQEDQRVEKEPEAAVAICELLEYLPLGIELVGGYLVKDPEISLLIILQELQDQKLATEALQQQATLISSQLGVKAAFNLTWERLNPLAQQLGRLLSLFSPQSILWDLVVWVATGDEEEATGEEDEEQKQEENPLNWSAQELNEARKQLYERNLLQKVEETEGYYKIHSLVKWFLQSQLVESGEMKSVLERTFATAMITIAQNIPPSPISEDIEFFKDTIPHLEELGRRLIKDIEKSKEEQVFSLLEVKDNEVIWVFTGIGRFYEGQGLYKLAEPWREECLAVCQVLFTGDHPDVASSLNNLAGLYDSQGRYSEAEPLYTEALAMYERVLGINHPSTVTVRENLTTLQRQRTPLFTLMDWLGYFVGILLSILILPFYLLWLLFKWLLSFILSH